MNKRSLTTPVKVLSAMAAVFAAGVIIFATGCSGNGPGDDDIPVVTDGGVVEEHTWYSAEKTRIGSVGITLVTRLFPVVNVCSNGNSISVSSCSATGYDVSYSDSLVNIRFNDREMTEFIDEETMSSMTNPNIGGNYYSYDVYPFTLNGQDYFEVIKLDFSYSEYESYVYEMDEDGNYGAPVTLSGLSDVDNAAIISCFPLKTGSALLISNSITFDMIGSHTDSSIVIYGNDGSINDIDVDSLLDIDYQTITDVSQLSEDLLLVSYMDYDIGDVIRKAVDMSDPSEPSVAEDDVIPACIGSMDNVYSLSDGTVCMSDDACLYTLSDEGEPEFVLDYALSGVNMAACREMRLLKRNEDGTMDFFLTEFFDPMSSDPTAYAEVKYLVKLTPREPDTRQILRVGVPDSMTYWAGQSIVDFNETNENYFARVEIIGGETDDYSFSVTLSVDPDDILGGSEYGVYLNTLSYDSGIVEEALRSDPPDVFISETLYMTEPASDLFLDLNDFIDSENGLDRSEYFDNILRLSESDGHQYHIPTAFYISGIRLYNEGYHAEFGGMTYSEYRDLTSSMGGWDPIKLYCERNIYVEELISSQYDLFVDRENGTANFHNAAFYALLDYVDDIGDYDSIANGYYYTIDADTYDNMMRLDYGNIYALEEYYMDDSYSWYGLPSYDGRGVSAGPTSTAAIPAGSSNPEGAWELIRYIVSYDQQSYYSIGIPICRNAVTHVLRNDQDSVSYIMDVIDSAGSYYVTDLDLRYICDVAIGSYLNGECSADETADIIENYMLEIMGSSGRQEEEE